MIPELVRLLYWNIITASKTLSTMYKVEYTYDSYINAHARNVDMIKICTDRQANQIGQQGLKAKYSECQLRMIYHTDLDPVIFRFKICLFPFHTSAIPLHSQNNQFLPVSASF